MSRTTALTNHHFSFANICQRIHRGVNPVGSIEWILPKTQWIFGPQEDCRQQHLYVLYVQQVNLIQEIKDRREWNNP